MPRGNAKIKKQDLIPDEKYGSIVVEKLINYVMLDGKKIAAKKIVYAALDKSSGLFSYLFNIATNFFGKDAPHIIVIFFIIFVLKTGIIPAEIGRTTPASLILSRYE